MKDRRHLGGLLGCVVSAAALLSGGCLLPYAYPNLSIVPLVSTEAMPKEVHAFRVDATTHRADMGMLIDYSLTRVQLDKDGLSWPQARLTLDYGVYVAGIALNYPIHHGHTTLVRLYRPGFQLVEIGAWEGPERVKWQPAPNLATQEKAIDNLIDRPECTNLFFSGAGRPCWDNGLSPGSSSPAQRESLLFAASEYERLGQVPGPSQASLRNKAQAVRDLAGR